jgi:succinate dehydrogenase / fumarate reductase cytochrome b subunit
VNKQRPVNLDLITINFPPAALSSILHRVTGVALFFALLFVVWAWAMSLSSEEGFVLVVELMNGVLGKIVLIGTLSALIYHTLGGVRHMIMDLGYWEEVQSGNASASIIIGLWVIITAVLGVILW